MGVLLFFVDGFGMGADNPDCNPLVAAPTPCIRRLLAGPLMQRDPDPEALAAVHPVDACLGVPGIPQSATGQATLFTGVNAPQLVGHHVSGFPTRQLRQLIAEQGMYQKVLARGFTADYANAYTPGYFRQVEAGLWKHSVTTVAALAAGLELHPLEDIAAGRAVYQDLTGKTLRDKGFLTPEMTPYEAGRTLAQISAGFDLTVFEYFQTDMAGHSGDFARAVETVSAVDQALAGMCNALPADTTLVICSDHGNIEDMSRSTHTTNPVPVILYGPGRSAQRSIRAITDVAPLVMGILEGEN